MSKGAWTAVIVIALVVIIGGVWVFTDKPTEEQTPPSTSSTTPDQQQQKLSEKQVINIGAILPLTGPAAPFGVASANALKIAIEEINSGSDNYEYRLYLEDGEANPKTSIACFNSLLDEKEATIIITMVSSIALALIPLAEEEDCVLFANASHPDVTLNSEHVLRFSNLASDEAKTVSEFCLKQTPAWKDIFVIAQNDEYGRVYASELERIANTKGEMFNVVGTEFYDSSTTDFRTIATKVLEKQTASTMIVGFGKPLGLCIRQLKELGYEKPFIASLGFVLSTDAVLSAGGEMTNGHYLNFNFVNSDASQKFQIQYFNAYQTTPAPNSLIDYSTALLIQKAIEKVGPNPEEIISYIKSLGSTELPTGEVHISKSGDIVAGVQICSIPTNGSIDLWNNN